MCFKNCNLPISIPYGWFSTTLHMVYTKLNIFFNQRNTFYFMHTHFICQYFFIILFCLNSLFLCMCVCVYVYVGVSRIDWILFFVLYNINKQNWATCISCLAKKKKMLKNEWLYFFFFFLSKNNFNKFWHLIGRWS